MKTRLLALALLAGCGAGGSPSGDDGGGDPAPDAAVVPAPLEVASLGVMGFALTHRGDTVLTAPMFTRQSLAGVTLGLPLAADAQAIESGLAGVPLSQLRAIVSGHAHYDHFLDVAHILELAPGASSYGNASGSHMLAALAPDRPASCTSPAPAQPLARSRVVAMDDAAASHVDYTNCPDLRPPGAPLDGTWLQVPGSRVRLKAFCAVHPDQIGPIHFGAGSVDADLCELPRKASDWLEGRTLAFLIDFLDERGAPELRVFYQDAPTNAPIGHVPPAVLAERGVDLALLCVGSYNAVTDHPGQIVASLQPRFALSGHWEDFFQPLGEPPKPIPLLDLDTYVRRADTALPGTPPAPLLVDGIPSTRRHVLAQPGMRLIVPP